MTFWWSKEVKEDKDEKLWRGGDIRRICRALKTADDIPLPESGAYYDALHARIMGALDEAIESGAVENRQRLEGRQTSEGRQLPAAVAPMSNFLSPIRGWRARNWHWR